MAAALQRSSPRLSCSLLAPLRHVPARSTARWPTPLLSLLAPLELFSHSPADPGSLCALYPPGRSAQKDKVYPPRQFQARHPAPESRPIAHARMLALPEPAFRRPEYI